MIGYRCLPMSRRIEIELTSNRGDGTWTWRAAGAREPKGIVPASLLPADCSPSAVYRAEVETDLDGTTVVSVIPNKQRNDRTDLIQLLPSERPFEAVTTKLRKDKPRRGDSKGGPRKRGPDGDRGDRGSRDARGERGERGDRGGRERRGPSRPRHEAPPEVPMRPRAKRLKAGRAHVAAVLAGLSDAEKVFAELVVSGGIPAVRKAAAAQNEAAVKSGAAGVPVDSAVAIAEKLQPRLHLADWRDRADAAMAIAEEIDLRDLRSVVSAGEDPVIVREESTRALAAELKAILLRRQEEETKLWLADIAAATEVGRVVRALKTSSQPPKAGVLLPAELSARLVAATVASLTADAPADRWVVVLEAAAFSPVHKAVVPPAPPQQVTEELTKTVTRLAPLMPDVARLFGIVADSAAAKPRPLRPQRPAAKPAQGGRRDTPRPNAGQRPERSGVARPATDQTSSAVAVDTRSAASEESVPTETVETTDGAAAATIDTTASVDTTDSGD